MTPEQEVRCQQDSESCCPQSWLFANMVSWLVHRHSSVCCYWAEWKEDATKNSVRKHHTTYFLIGLHNVSECMTPVTICPSVHCSKQFKLIAVIKLNTRFNVQIWTVSFWVQSLYHIVSSWWLMYAAWVMPTKSKHLFHKICCIVHTEASVLHKLKMPISVQYKVWHRINNTVGKTLQIS